METLNVLVKEIDGELVLVDKETLTAIIPINRLPLGSVDPSIIVPDAEAMLMYDGVAENLIVLAV